MQLQGLMPNVITGIALVSTCEKGLQPALASYVVVNALLNYNMSDFVYTVIGSVSEVTVSGREASPRVGLLELLHM